MHVCILFSSNYCMLLSMWVYPKDEVRREIFTTLQVLQINPIMNGK